MGEFVRRPPAIVVKFRRSDFGLRQKCANLAPTSSRDLLMPWGSTRTGAIAVESGEWPLILQGRLRPLINFGSRIPWRWEDGHRSFSVSLQLTYAAGNVRCKRRRDLNSIAAFLDPILPSSYGPILSQCGGNQYLHRQRTGSFYEELPYGKQEPSPPSDEMAGVNLSSPPTAISPAWHPPPVT
jgi:hypothetical protein